MAVLVFRLGWIGFLGQDWSTGGNTSWNDTLDRMVDELMGPCEVSLFFNASFTDTDQDINAEANNVKMPYLQRLAWLDRWLSRRI